MFNGLAVAQKHKQNHENCSAFLHDFLLTMVGMDMGYSKNL
jgi:hypothetical protein